MNTIFSKNRKITRSQMGLGIVVGAQSVRLFGLWGHLAVVVFALVCVAFDLIYKDNK